VGQKNDLAEATPRLGLWHQGPPVGVVARARARSLRLIAAAAGAASDLFRLLVAFQRLFGLAA
jgi:hypothetical protein